MITIVFAGKSSDLELIELQKMEVNDAFLVSHPNSLCELTVFSGIKQYAYSFTNNWKGIEDIDEDVIKRICNNHKLSCSLLIEGVLIKSFSSDMGEFVQSNLELSKDINIKSSNDNNYKDNPSAENQEFFDKRKLGIKSYEAWVKDEKFYKNIGALIMISVFVIISLITLNYISDNGLDFYGIIGIIIALLCLRPFFTSWKMDTSIEAYESYSKEIRNKDAEAKERRAEIQKNIVELEEKKKNVIEEKKKPYFKKIETIEANLDALKAVELFSVGKFKSSISELERQILEKSNPETLQKFVRIGKFLNEVESHLNAMRSSMIEDFMSTNLRSKVLYELQKSPKELEQTKIDYVLENQENLLKKLEGKKVLDLGNYWSELERLDKLMNLAVKHSENAIGAFQNESKDLNYLENMAISMVVFLIEGRNILYFEIMEFFDGLGALDSSWEKNIKASLNGIKISLDNLGESITGLGDSINRMTGQNDLILKELSSIDSSIKFGNLIQSITAYNTYKIKRNLSSNK